MKTTNLDCGLVILSNEQGGAVTSGGSRYAITEADGETIIETAPSMADARVRALEIAALRSQSKLLSLLRESVTIAGGGTRVVDVGGQAYRVEVGVGPLGIRGEGRFYFGHVPLTVAMVTHADDQGRPLTWAVTSDEGARLRAIIALPDGSNGSK